MRIDEINRVSVPGHCIIDNLREYATLQDKQYFDMIR